MLVSFWPNSRNPGYLPSTIEDMLYANIDHGHGDPVNHVVKQSRERFIRQGLVSPELSQPRTLRGCLCNS
jgi:hypothetical protein